MAVRKFRTDLNDTENRPSDVLRELDRVKPSRNDMEEARERLTEAIYVAGEEELH